MVIFVLAGNFFFNFFFFFFFFFFLISVLFLQKKGWGVRSCGCPSGHNFVHPLDRKLPFFKGGLTYLTCHKAILKNNFVSCPGLKVLNK